MKSFYQDVANPRWVDSPAAAGGFANSISEDGDGYFFQSSIDLDFLRFVLISDGPFLILEYLLCRHNFRFSRISPWATRTRFTATRTPTASTRVPWYVRVWSQYKSASP